MNCENFYVTDDENTVLLFIFFHSSPSPPPQFSVHPDIFTTPPITDVFVAQQEHINLNLEKIIVFLAQEIPPLTLMAPQT